MRRPHRTIETFDISLMAVVTKAMGAFLVLMLLLLPYYTPEPREDDATELLRQLKAMNARLDEVSKQLGDPDKGVAELRKDLGKVSVDSTLRAQVLAKLEGLIHKAFSEVRRLESEVADLKKENQQLRAENQDLKDLKQRLEAENKDLKDQIDALNKRIAELEAELEKLRKLKPEEKYRAVTASFSATGCNGISLQGVILKEGSDNDYTWIDDKSKIAPEWLLNVDFQDRGGEVPEDDQKLSYPINESFLSFQTRGNAATLIKRDVGLGNYVIGLVKKDPSRTWDINGKLWRLLTSYGEPCDIIMSTAARFGSHDAWIGEAPFQIRMKPDVIAGVVLAFTSDKDGVKFRAPSEAERHWFDHLLQLGLKYQDEIPAYKKEREAQARREKEEAERRARERQEHEKQEEAARRAAEPPSNNLQPEISPDDKGELARMHIKAIEARLKTLPPGPMHDDLERQLKLEQDTLEKSEHQGMQTEPGSQSPPENSSDPRDVRARLEDQRSRLVERLKTIPEGPARQQLESVIAHIDEMLKAEKKSGPGQ
jgi:FtsZ-binding cell division protein ZapB